LGARPPLLHLPLPLQVAQAKALQLLRALPDFPASLQGRVDLAAAAAAGNSSSSGGGLAKGRGGLLEGGNHKARLKGTDRAQPTRGYA
jgi:hypothetical protein